MRLVDYKTGINIDFEQESINILQLENAKVMFDVCNDLFKQCSGEDGNFVLSDDLKTLNFADCCQFIPNIFDLGLNGKKIENLLQKKLQSIINGGDYAEQFFAIDKSIVELNNKLLPNIDLQISYNDDLQFCDIFKICGYKIEEKQNLFDRIIDYVDVVSELSKTKLFIFVDLFPYISQEQTQKLVKQFEYMDIKVLFVTSFLPYKIDNVKKTIVDADLCMI